MMDESDTAERWTDTGGGVIPNGELEPGSQRRRVSGTGKDEAPGKHPPERMPCGWHRQFGRGRR